jgi:hypothetical protein
LYSLNNNKTFLIFQLKLLISNPQKQSIKSLQSIKTIHLNFFWMESSCFSFWSL